MSEGMPTIPKITDELLDYLKITFRDRAPSLPDLRDPAAVAFKAGEVSVVRHLEGLKEDQ